MSYLLYRPDGLRANKKTHNKLLKAGRILKMNIFVHDDLVFIGHNYKLLIMRREEMTTCQVIFIVQLVSVRVMPMLLKQATRFYTTLHYITTFSCKPEMKVIVLSPLWGAIHSY